jgi:hypothetical protein
VIRRLCALGLSAAAVAAAAAQAPVPRAFRYERSVQIASAGPQRLDLDAALLAGARPFAITAAGDRRVAVGGLQDLRLFTSDNVEVPYLVVAPPPVEPTWMAGRILPIAEIDSDTERTSGFEVDLGDSAVVDAVRLTGMRAPFLKRFRLEGSGDRERWTLLIAEGTAFDLPAETLRQTEFGFDAGSYRYLRVTWDDTRSGRVAPPAAADARRLQAPAPAPVLRVPLGLERRPSEPRTSRFRLRLPGARLPIAALEVTVGETNVLREATVFEGRLSGDRVAPQLIARSTLRRVERDGISADVLRIPLVDQPREAQLELVVNDGDNPPLDLRGVTAVFAELPWIYFDASPGTITARYGDARLEAPRYDLEAAREELPNRATARARWGEASPVALEAETPEAAMPETGSSVDVAAFRYARELPAGEGGLLTVPLDAAILAHSSSGVRNGFADVRVVDEVGRQVPYLLERRDEPLAIDVRIERRDLPAPLARSGHSSYVVHLPYETVPSGRVALRTPARVFQRSLTLAVMRPPNERQREPRLVQAGTARWVHAMEDRPAPPLVLAVPERRDGDLVLLVDEGDNQPLPIDRVTLLLPSYALRLFQPRDRPLRVVYGHQTLGPPEYDLALLAPQVLGSMATEVMPGPELPAAASRENLALVSPPIFWGALAVAVLVLLGVIVRLIRRTDAPDTAG